MFSFTQKFRTLGFLSGLGCAVIMPQSLNAQQLNFKEPDVIAITATDFLMGSTQSEREYGYQLDEKAYGSAITRKQRWYDFELNRKSVHVNGFKIMKTPVTNRQYAVFIEETGHKAPFVDEQEWRGYRLIHPYRTAQKYLWKNGVFPQGKADHPVVLVNVEDAKAYARWLSVKTQKTWRLPSEEEWELAARGTDGRIFPWGDRYDATFLNTEDRKNGGTQPVGQYPQGASPYGVLDMAGQVYEWTSLKAANARTFVKGGGWDDFGCGVCRSAARHNRPSHMKHVLIGFRLVQE